MLIKHFALNHSLQEAYFEPVSIVENIKSEDHVTQMADLVSKLADTEAMLDSKCCELEKAQKAVTEIAETLSAKETELKALKQQIEHQTDSQMSDQMQNIAKLQTMVAG